MMYVLEKPMPVDVRHQVSFHVVHDSSLLALVNGECLQWLSIEIKLCQHDCVVACYQRTRGVAIILQTARIPVMYLQL